MAEGREGDREADRLRGLLADAQARGARLEAELQAARAEIAALRSPISWKVTGPLRTMRGWVGG